jgi:AcrR family transcriptional regulator
MTDMANAHASPARPRPLRADARRNRDRILDAARHAFAEQGLDVSNEEIARRARVGAGTRYRRFPTKQALTEALFEQRLDELEPVSRRALAGDDGWAGLVELLHAAIALQARDQGFLETVAERLGPELPSDLRERLFGPMAALLARAQAAGDARADLDADDLPVLLRMAGSSTARRIDGRPMDADWPRYVALLLDGLRAPPAR